MRWGGRSPPWCWSGGGGRWRCSWPRRSSCSSTTSSTTRASIPRCRSRWPWPPPGPPATAAGRCWSPACSSSPASGSATRPWRHTSRRSKCWATSHGTSSCSRPCCCSGRRSAPAARSALEQERSERLLLNMLPAPIATRLKQHEDVIADGFAEVTVLFADLVDFTRRSQRSSPQQVVQVLDELFSAFDQLDQAPRAGEDQDHRRRLHGRRRAARAAVRPRPGGGRAGPGHARGGRPARRPQRPAAPGPHRHRHRPGGGRGHRQRQVQLRPVGRHRQHRQPHGIHTGSPAASRSPTAPTSGCGTATGSSGGGRSRSRARARWSPTSLSEGTNDAAALAGRILG